MLQKTINKLKQANWKFWLIKGRNFSIILIIILVFVPFVIFASIKHAQQDNLFYNPNEVPSKRVAIVFGAGVGGNQQPTPVLRDRILTAVDLYEKGKVKKIIMSGDNRFVDYDEPNAMIEYAKQHDIPEEALQPDYAGRRTYDTCYRAKYIFGVDEAILVTQDFHLTRALYTCNSIGIDSIGVTANLSTYPNLLTMQVRDIYALTLSVWDINMKKPSVVLGEEIEI